MGESAVAFPPQVNVEFSFSSPGRCGILILQVLKNQPEFIDHIESPPNVTLN